MKLHPLEEFDLITADSDTLSGKPRIRDTRISVRDVLELVADGASLDDVLRSWPELSREAVEQAIRFAAECMDAESAGRLAG